MHPHTVVPQTVPNGNVIIGARHPHRVAFLWASSNTKALVAPGYAMFAVDGYSDTLEKHVS